MRRSVYFVVKVTPEKVFIVDANTGHLSVTNDAEAVCEELFGIHGQKRFIYRDSEGQWDELAHDEGIFTDFMPYKDGELP